MVLGLLAKGASNKNIARHLGIVEATVKVHVRSLFRKICVDNRTQAAVWARDRVSQLKLLPVDAPIDRASGLPRGLYQTEMRLPHTETGCAHCTCTGGSHRNRLQGRFWQTQFYRLGMPVDPEGVCGPGVASGIIFTVSLTRRCARLTQWWLASGHDENSDVPCSRYFNQLHYPITRQ